MLQLPELGPRLDSGPTGSTGSDLVQASLGKTKTQESKRGQIFTLLEPIPFVELEALARGWKPRGSYSKAKEDPPRSRQDLAKSQALAFVTSDKLSKRHRRT